MIEFQGTARAVQDNINVNFWFKELLICYKFGEKARFEKAFDILKPYMDDRLIILFEEIHDNTLWLNPITGKRGR